MQKINLKKFLQCNKKKLIVVGFDRDQFCDFTGLCGKKKLIWLLVWPGFSCYMLQTRFSQIYCSIAIYASCTFGYDSVSDPDSPVTNHFKTVQRCPLWLDLDIRETSLAFLFRTGDIWWSIFLCARDHCSVERQQQALTLCASMAPSK